MLRRALVFALINVLLPVSWAQGFPEPRDARLCPPGRESPPRNVPPPSDPATGGPTVRILNPVALSGAPAELSDRYDGVDRRYHITAVAQGAPEEAIVEAYVQPRGSTEVLLGTLCPVPGTADTFEGFWDIPESFSEGPADLKIKLFDRPGTGATVVATDGVAVDLQHLEAGSRIAAETVAIRWPLNDGPLGFFRNKAGAWKAHVEGIGSGGATSFNVQYSTSSLSATPSFKTCGTTFTTTTRESDNAKIVTGACTLSAGDRPSAVTALAMIAQSGGNEASDVNRVHPFEQTSSDMKLTLRDVLPSSITDEWPSGRRRITSKCLEFIAHVEDRYGRPVVGARVDVELRGPQDAVFFADPVDAAVPEGAAVRESAVTCQNGTAHAAEQGRLMVADGPDAKVIESAGTGTTASGDWGFKVFSTDPGVTSVTAWVDDEPLPSEMAERPPDDDQRGPEEAFDTIEAQWLGGPVRLDISPRDGASPLGTCRIYRLTAVAGAEVLPALNVDLHLRQTDPKLRLCGPSADSLRAPDSEHAAGDTHPAETTQCPNVGFPCIHVEGNTDDAGEIVFGLTSNNAGEASITAWADGEPGTDTDLFTTTKAKTTISTRWVVRKGDVGVTILSHPGSTRISTDSFKVVTQIDSPYLVERVWISLSRGSGDDWNFRGVLLGEAKRVGHTDIYEFEWDLNRPIGSTVGPSPSASPSPSSSPSTVPVPGVTSVPIPSPSVTLPPGPNVGVRPGVPDASNYVLHATIEGGASVTLEGVQVNRSLDPPDDQTPAYEWVEITQPRNGEPLGFVDGATTVQGTASAAEGVDFFYATKGSSSPFAWTACGYKRLNVLTTTANQAFGGTCELHPSVRPSEVIAIAATAFDCTVTTGNTGACADPGDAPVAPGVTLPRERRGALEASNAVLVAGCDGSPCIRLLPSRWRQKVGECMPMSVMAADLNEPALGQPIVVEVKGPTDSVRFCNPLDEREDTWPGVETVEVDRFGPDIHRISGKTGLEGTFDFGVYSDDSTFESMFSLEESGSSLVRAWADDGDGTHEEGEATSRSTLHWELPLRCTILGTDRGEVIVGTSDNDVICALGGNDKIFGAEGNDIIFGGAGDDVINGDVDADTLFGEAGNDVLAGGDQRDKIFGGDGSDRLRGGQAGDSLFGEADDDELLGGAGNDKLDGGDGRDTCDVGAGKKDMITACESEPQPVEGKRSPRSGP